MSSVRDAIAGRPRRRDQDSSVAGGGETPRVNGYAFVDDNESDLGSAPPLIDLGPGDSHNPFKVQQPRKRESLHEQMVDRIAKSNKESSTQGFTGKITKTPVPKFPSSPRVSGDLTPAAQRLWSSMGTPKDKTPGSSFGVSTPMRPRGLIAQERHYTNHEAEVEGRPSVPQIMIAFTGVWRLFGSKDEGMVRV
ncbi:hypothetical protein ACCO45_008422 [Purpureocillium lilacinum]|uniref:Uncharacterized protein n=1 Tax=Purpureocillium lilacinum TaxID=33203 RepID=A0ACC4DNG4_PURLI